MYFFYVPICVSSGCARTNIIWELDYTEQTENSKHYSDSSQFFSTMCHTDIIFSKLAKDILVDYKAASLDFCEAQARVRQGSAWDGP